MTERRSFTLMAMLALSVISSASTAFYVWRRCNA